MTRLLLTLALVFAFSASPPDALACAPKAGKCTDTIVADQQPEPQEESRVTTNGYAAYTVLDYRGNKPPFPNLELGFGAGYRLTDSLSAYGSVRYTDDDIGKKFDVTSAYLIHTGSVLDLEVTTQLGRIRNCYCLFNYRRYNPVSRGMVVLPQAIYWQRLDEVAGFSDGASTSVYHADSGIGVHGSITNTTITDSRPVNEHFFMPGRIEGGRTVKYGVDWHGHGFFTGYQRIEWGLKSDLIGHQDVKLDNWHVGWGNDRVMVSYEAIKMSTSIGRQMGLPGATGQSATVFFSVTPEVRVYANVNEIDYRIPALDMMGWKNKAIDRNFGVTYKPTQFERLSFRLEHHRVTGASWYSIDDNPAGTQRKSSFTALQALYSF